jgi:hypothetical protein
MLLRRDNIKYVLEEQVIMMDRWDKTVLELRWHFLPINLTPADKLYSVILLVLDPRKCKYPKNYSLDFKHAYITTYLAS